MIDPDSLWKDEKLPISAAEISEDLYQQVHWPASYDYLEQTGTQNAHTENYL